MSEDEAIAAHEASERFQQSIVDMGVAQLSHLTESQLEYVLNKAADEFRFWRVEDAIVMKQGKRHSNVGAERS